MTDMETPWLSLEAASDEAEWFDAGPIASEGDGLTDDEALTGQAFPEPAFPEQAWPAAEPTTETRTGSGWPESPFEVPVDGVDEREGGAGVAFGTTGVEALNESVAGCGTPVSGTPPMIHRGTTALRSRNPWVGRAQTLLNTFLDQQRAGTESCADTRPATRQYIAALRAKLAPLGQDPLTADCKFGEGTEKATLMFQACRGLVRDGKIGEKTWPHLLALGSTPRGTPTPTSGVRVRQDVWTLSATSTWHPTLLWYARGVRALQARNGSDFRDPRCWRHLAETHGTDVDRSAWPSGARWKQCEHFTWHFLPWHRAYLHHFERVMREEIARLGGPADWALPFWDYTDGVSRPEVRSLPPAFREAALPDGTSNPLRVSGRDPGINGGARLHPDVVDTRGLGTAHVFTPASSVAVHFGGLRGPVGSHKGAAGSAAGALEGTPHGSVHVAVGGTRPGANLMARFETAGQDPVFWLHHANIDRMWEAWLRDRPATHRNPTDRAWLDASWAFGSGSMRTSIATHELLDPRQPPLGYRYSDMPLTPTPEAEGEWFDESVGAGPGDEAGPPELVGASESEIPLGPNATTTRIRLGRPSGPAAGRLGEGERVPPDVTVFLRLENITGTAIHTSGVVVYVNLPSGGRPADFPDRRAGVVSMFGVIETSRRDDRHSGSGLGATFDITRIARALSAAGQWDRTSVAVTFVPIPDATGTVGSGDVTVGRVSVFYA
jgi:tyrosinase